MKMLKFNELVGEINKLEIGTIVKSETGDKYKLTLAENEQRKFSRADGTKLRFMTYDNIDKCFEIIEEPKEIDIQGIEELDRYGDAGMEFYDKIDIHIAFGKINEIIQALKQIDKK